MRYPILAAHISPNERTTQWSIHSNDPYEIIEWLGSFIESRGYQVLFDHDYSSEETNDTA